MNRPLTYLFGPETALAAFTTLLFLFCARHNSGVGRDVGIMEKLVWPLPFLTALATLPIGVVLGVAVTFVGTILIAFYVEVLKR